ncbi:MAG: cation transporter [Abditibacteriota bacterium]|nr:cation transporter [Abditibacteriota bacterium]
MDRTRKPLDEKKREQIIVRTSAAGITANVFLAAFKAVVGYVTGSIAITLDAVNNISDAASSVITIAGTKMAGKKPDKQHPFGHGRFEYLTAMIIAVFILYAGMASLAEAVKHIVRPRIPEYDHVSLIIIGAAVAVKLVMGIYVKRMGRLVNSDPLVNSGEDARLDAVISASTLVAAGIFMIYGVSLEAWLAAAISAVIIWSGYSMLKNTISQILGERSDPDLVKAIKQTVTSFPDVGGAYDIVLNNYGPDSWSGSVHIEVPDTYQADRLDLLIRDIQEEVYRKHRVVLTAIGVYSVNTKDDEVIRIENRVREIVFSHKYVTQLHGFYLIKDTKTIRFDIVISFDAGDRIEIYRHILDDLEKAFPGYKLQAALDMDFTEA